MVCWMTISTLNNCVFSTTTKKTLNNGAIVCWNLLKNDVKERGDENSQHVEWEGTGGPHKTFGKMLLVALIFQIFISS